MKRFLAASIIVFCTFSLCAQSSSSPQESTPPAKSVQSSQKPTPVSLALAALEAIDKYEANSEKGPTTEEGVELARKSRLAVNKAKQADMWTGSKLELLLTDVEQIVVAQMQVLLGRPSQVQDRVASFRKQRADVVDAIKKRQAEAASPNTSAAKK